MNNYKNKPFVKLILYKIQRLPHFVPKEIAILTLYIIQEMFLNCFNLTKIPFVKPNQYHQPFYSDKMGKQRNSTNLIDNSPWWATIVAKFVKIPLSSVIVDSTLCRATARF